MVLGNLQSKDVQFNVQIPSFVPPQPLEFVDATTGKKKIFTVNNAQKLIDLVQQGYNLVDKIKGGTGEREVVVVRSQTDIKPTQAGFGKIGLIIGGLFVLGTLFYTLRNR